MVFVVCNSCLHFLSFAFLLHCILEKGAGEMGAGLFVFSLGLFERVNCDSLIYSRNREPSFKQVSGATLYCSTPKIKPPLQNRSGPLTTFISWAFFTYGKGMQLRAAPGGWIISPPELPIQFRIRRVPLSHCRIFVPSTRTVTPDLSSESPLQFSPWISSILIA